jgi:hypothetical protein
MGSRHASGSRVSASSGLALSEISNHNEERASRLSYLNDTRESLAKPKRNKYGDNGRSAENSPADRNRPRDSYGFSTISARPSFNPNKLVNGVSRGPVDQGLAEAWN